MISLNRFYTLLFVAFATLSACTSDSDKTETVTCDGKCIVIFKPDTALVNQFLQGDDKTEYMEVLGDHEHYANEYKKMADTSGVKVIESTASRIAVENGNAKKEFDAREGEELFGFILTKPNAEPEIHRGIFTDMEYQMHAQKYFK